MNPNPKCPVLPWMINFKPSDKEKPSPKQYAAASADTAIGHLSGLTYKSNPSPFRSTRFIFTINTMPSTAEVENMLMMGVSILRISALKNDTVREILRKVRLDVESYSRKIGRPCPLGIALEIKGPVIRTGKLKDKKNEIFLDKGQTTKITTDSAYEEFVDKDIIYVDYEKLPEIVRPGDNLVLQNDGVTLSALECVKSVIKCIVERAGKLISHSSVVMPNSIVQLPRLTAEDKELVKICKEEYVDFLFVSGLTSTSTLKDIKEFLVPGGETIQIVPQIENVTLVNDFDDFIKIADGICIDCEKLMLDVPKEKVFLIQKSLLAKCNLAGKPVISTVILSQEDITKAEICDIANAVIDGTDALLFAPRDFSKTTFSTLDSICREAEVAIHQKVKFVEIKDSLSIPFEPIYSLAISVLETAFKSNAAAIICLTSSGRTAKVLSRFRPRCPVITVTRYARVARQLQILFGIDPLLYPKPFGGNWCKDVEERVQYAITYGKYAGLIRMGDVIVTLTSSRPETGLVNTMKVVFASEFDAISKKPKK